MKAGERVEEICKERHRVIDERLKDHGKQLDKLSEDGREYKVQIQNLCKDINSLVTTIRWFMGLLAGSLVGFFFYAIQNSLFK